VTNTIRTIMVVALVILGALVSLKIRAATPKKPAPQVWTPAQSGLAFEDSAGTLRFLTNIPCDGTPAVALEIRRTAPNSSNGGN
jgi:hypothetical protein